MRFLKTSEAATLLNVSPNTLRAWERRFGYPKPQRSPGKHRLYTHGEIAALRDALQEGLSISSAISRAREGLSADGDTLMGALGSFDRDRADSSMEAVLALRSLERSVEEILLPSLEELVRRHGTDSAKWAFAARWGCDWLRRAQRLAPPPVRQVAVLLGDASGDELDLDNAYTRALELFCVRSGAKTLSLSVQGAGDLGDVVSQLKPHATVVCGSYSRDDEVARWAYAVRTAAGAVPVALYRRDIARPGRLRATGSLSLSSSPLAAAAQLMESIEVGASHETAAQTPASGSVSAAPRSA